MGERRKYLKNPKLLITAVQLNLDTAGFTYEKWGSTQRCSAGDWIVNSGDDTYTVSRDSFARTYEHVANGGYRKITPIWAEVATESGRVATTEGTTSYKPGDYLVSNDPEGHDQYAISKAKFERMYVPADEHTPVLHTTSREK